MNTRLQVEHPVTELVTGIDLVEQMIRVAAGEKLALKQSDVKLEGWAVESRVYAEDPYRNFLPSTGRLTRYRPPAERAADGVTVRNDTGVYEGGEISIYYDPMIAKLVTHAPTRAQAIDAQADALDAFVIDGIRHNIPFLSALMAHPRWRAGKLSTGFIAEEFPDGFHAQAPEGERAAVLAAVAVAIDHVLGERKRRISGQLAGRAVQRARLRAVALGDKTSRSRLPATARPCGSATARAARSRPRALHCRSPIAKAAARAAMPARARSRSSRAGSRASRSGPAPSTAMRWRCRCARRSTALRCPIAASRPRPMSIPRRKPRSRA